MIKNIVLLLLIGFTSCAQSNLEKENQELLLLTEDLKSIVGELKLEAEKQREMALMAAAEARMAEAEALEQAALANTLKAELQQKLKDCK